MPSSPRPYLRDTAISIEVVAVPSLGTFVLECNTVRGVLVQLIFPRSALAPLLAKLDAAKRPMGVREA